MTKEQALFVMEALDQIKDLSYYGIAKSFYKKYGPSDYCLGPIDTKGSLFADEDGKKILNLAKKVLDAPE